MSTLEFGIFDSFGPFEMEEFPTVVEVYEAHMREAQEAEQLGYRPALELAGPIDSAVPSEIRTDLLAVLREALSNVVRHAAATRVQVAVKIQAGKVIVSVSDNGIGIPADVARSGLSNLSARAERIGGTFDIRSNAPQGTVVEWCVPL